MDNEKLVVKWQGKIVEICESILERELDLVEVEFIKKRGGFMALEMIEDSVKNMDKEELIRYLRSES